MTILTPGEPKASAGPTIDPAALYSKPDFLSAAGLGAVSMRRARDLGIKLETIKAGRRKFVKGSDGIDFLIRFAAATAGDDS
ncbi:MAG: hypothetical protein AAF916_11140 [Planctomycetota bacterium]